MRKKTMILLLSFTLSLAIEIIQYSSARGAADIDDVILNVAGSIAGYASCVLSSRLFKSQKHAVFISAAMIIINCVGFYSFNNYKFLVPRFDTPLLEDVAGNAKNVNVQTKWCLILVNKWNPIPEDYVVELAKLPNGQLVDKRIYTPLQEMFDAARSAGVYPVVTSGYRTAAEQKRLMDEKSAAYKNEGYSTEESVIKAEEWVAIPGTSEHQIGLAIDINADGIRVEDEKVYEWLYKNAYKYGFIRRYPPGKSEITGISYEPWHYRYVGIEAATEIHSCGICLEEYVNM